MNGWLVGFIVTVLAAVAVGDAKSVSAQLGEVRPSPLDYYDQFESEGPDNWLIRVRRDFNEDGREDQAITSPSGAA